ncbi:DUF6612 family protein [Sporosarcina sp. FSL W8-0480]|uniref:DUF6612 family protein n=1 Tax=Sporosarcina sp. FSL W8-0480 TaxID=2954701 RepID=UPI0030DBB62C
MKKIINALAVSSMLLLLAACSYTGKAQNVMSAGDLLDKSQEAMETSLKSVQSHIVYDETEVTVKDGDLENPERAGVKFDMSTVAFLDPVKVHTETKVTPRGTAPWNMDVYQVDDRVFVTDDKNNKWDELSFGSIAEVFGTLVSGVNPIVDLSKFKEFEDDFILQPIDYGYALKLSLDRNQLKQFKEIFPDIGSSQEGFDMVDRLDIVITFNNRTLYVTGFTMSSYIKTYKDSNSYRSQQKLNATYSYFNDAENFELPKEVKDLTSK